MTAGVDLDLGYVPAATPDWVCRRLPPPSTVMPCPTGTITPPRVTSEAIGISPGSIGQGRDIARVRRTQRHCLISDDVVDVIQCSSSAHLQPAIGWHADDTDRVGRGQG